MSQTIRVHTTFEEASSLVSNSSESRLLDTRRAFDSVASDYDGPIGNNALIRQMREAMWRTVTTRLPTGARLLDLGCGTGIDAAYFASRGYQVFATDWSSQMVARTRMRAAEAGLEGRITAETVGVQDLECLEGQTFDAIYSDLGPLNCLPDLHPVAEQCCKLLRPGGLLLASTDRPRLSLGVHLLFRSGELGTSQVAECSGMVPVNLNHHTVWTHYYSPGDFFKPFASCFRLTSYRALGLFVPPPYLIRLYERLHLLFAPLAWADAHLGALPVLREAGDHFLIVLTKRE